MNPPRLLLVDDEAPARARLRELLAKIAAEVPHSIAGEAMTGREALSAIEAGGVDVVLADIRMPEMGGIELARHLCKHETPPAVIFITAYDQHAIAAFEVNAIDYLLKPVRASRLADALRKSRLRGTPAPEALRRAAAEPRRYFSVAERGRINLVPVADTLYLKAELKYITLRTREREFLLEESLLHLEEEFSAEFVRIHRNCLVARAAMAGFERVGSGDEGHWLVVLHGVPERLPISRRQWPSVRHLTRSP